MLGVSPFTVRRWADGGLIPCLRVGPRGHRRFDPAALAEFTRRGRRIVSTRRIGPPRVLVIDDEQDVRELLRRVLEKEGYRVLTATDGEEGLSLAMRDRPDLIITDLVMPQMDGYTFLTRLRERRETAEVPVIVVSVKTDLPSTVFTVVKGAAAHVGKPFDVEELTRAVRQVLEGATFVPVGAAPATSPV